MERVDWSSLIAKFRKVESSISQSDFARKHNVKPGTFSYHLVRASRKAKKSVHVKARGGFTQVGGAQMIEVETKKGTVVRIPSDIDAESFKNIVEVLDERNS